MKALGAVLTIVLGVAGFLWANDLHWVTHEDYEPHVVLEDTRYQQLSKRMSCTECVRKCHDTCKLNGTPLGECVCACHMECGQ